MSDILNINWQKFLIRKNPENLKNITEQSEYICKYAVSINGLVLKYVHKQTLAICLTAVRNRNKSIELVDPEFKDRVLEIIKKRN
jgi:hypothetical protein